ncbi:hypothetical protein HCN44_001687 [Aphidius gifuensis]|uniref:Kinetochore protein NDC80 n=1 Tax=Aphidius gifuensis TaxID=684658 RepID=A0A834XVG6_APHGI|nr:kinetochore protein NDC80 homolog [Aphidius gifuensis]KAF7992362.1 hypothetical protein HCN44_001687 [Aphidius gifuensis]
MRSSASTGRQSSYNPPLRVSTMCPDEKSVATTKSEGRRTFKPRPSSEGSGIPKLRIGSDSSDGSRKSNLKQPGKTPLRSTTIMSQRTSTGMTPRAGRFHSDLPTGPRGRSSSAERCSTLGSQKMSKKDTRNLTNKSTQEAMLNRIDEYFRKQEKLDTSLSAVLNKNNSSFKPITLDSVVTATQFLCKKLDITTKPPLTKANYINELPKYGKNLKYPGNISKSWLITANTPHSYHHVLGWISWLVEIVDLKEKAVERFGKQIRDLPRDNLFRALLDLYVLWNHKKIKEEKLAENQYLQTVAEYSNATTEIFDNAQKEFDDVANKKRTIKDNAAKISYELDEITKKLEALKNDEDKQLQYIDEQEKCKIKYGNDSKSYEIEMKEIDIESKKITNENNQLIDEIKKQPMNAQQRDVKEQECISWRNFLKNIDEHLEELTKEIYKLDMNFSKSQTDLSKALFIFNRSIVCGIPENIMGKKLSELQMPEKITFEQNAKDLLKEKRKVIDEVKNQMMIEYDKTMLSFNNLTNEHEKLQDKLESIRRDKNELDAKNSEIKNSIKQCKIQGQEDEIKIRNQIIKLKDDIQKIKQSMPNIDTLSDELQEVQDQVEARSKKKLFLEQSGLRFFGRLHSMLSNHHNDILNIMSKLNDIKSWS